MVSYFAWRCSLKPWIIKKLGNFQLENCYRDVTDPVLAQVVGAVRVPSDGGTGGTALIHDNQMRLTCNFTDSAIREFEKKELETSESEFSDLKDALIVLERYRLVPTLFSNLRDCVFTIVVYAFSLKSFTKMSGEYNNTRMAHQHYRIAKKLKELWGQWKSGDLAFVTDESDSAGTITDVTLTQTIQFMEDKKEKNFQEDPETSKSSSEPDVIDEEQTCNTEGRNDQVLNQREPERQEEREGNLKAREASQKTSVATVQYNPYGSRKGSDVTLDDREKELTSAVFKVDVSTFSQMKCDKHQECILLSHPAPSCDGEGGEQTHVDDDLIEVLKALPILLYTRFPNAAPQDLPHGLYSWEVDALEEKEESQNGAGETAATWAASASISTNGPSEQSCSENQEEMVALCWPPDSPSVEEPTPGNFAPPSAHLGSVSLSTDQPGVANFSVKGGTSSVGSVHPEGEPTNVEANTKEMASIGLPSSKSNSNESKQIGSFVFKRRNMASVSGIANPSLPLISTANDDKVPETATREKSQARCGGQQANYGSEVAIPESSDSSSEVHPEPSLQSLSIERMDAPREADRILEEGEGEGEMEEDVQRDVVGRFSGNPAKNIGRRETESSLTDEVAREETTGFSRIGDVLSKDSQKATSLDDADSFTKTRKDGITSEDHSILEDSSAKFKQNVVKSAKGASRKLMENHGKVVILENEKEQSESSILLLEVEGHENVTSDSQSPELQSISKLKPKPVGEGEVVLCSSMDGNSSEATFDFSSLLEKNQSTGSPQSFPETQPFHVDDDESLQQYPETQPFDVDGSASPLRHQEEASQSHGREDKDWPSGETQPFSVTDCILPETAEDRQASVVFIKAGVGSSKISQDCVSSSLQDLPSSLLNDAFLQTQESQDKQLFLQSLEVDSSQRAEGSLAEKLLSRKKWNDSSSSASQEVKGQENQRNFSDSSDSLEDIFIGEASENSERLQMSGPLSNSKGGKSQGLQSYKKQSLSGEGASRDNSDSPCGINVQRKRKWQNVKRNCDGTERMILDGLQRHDKLRRTGSPPRNLVTDVSGGFIPSADDRGVRSVVASHKTSSEQHTMENNELVTGPTRGKKSICNEFIEMLEDLKCSCDESISDESQSSSCNFCQSHVKAIHQSTDLDGNPRGQLRERNLEERKVLSVHNSNPTERIQEDIISSTNTLNSSGIDKLRGREQSESKEPSFEAKVTLESKSKRKFRRMTEEEAAMSKRKLAEARFLKWLERKYSPKKKKGKKTKKSLTS